MGSFRRSKTAVTATDASTSNDRHRPASHRGTDGTTSPRLRSRRPVIRLLTAVVAAVSSFAALTATARPASAGSVCPAGWTCTDVGGALPPGQATLFNGILSAVGGGYDLFGTADSFFFVSQPLNGDGAVTTQVASVQPTDSDALAGVMLRNSTDAGSPYYGAFITPGVGLVVQWRSREGGPTTEYRFSGFSAPIYLRVSRYTTTGSAPQTYFGVQTSPDGNQWATLTGATVALNLAPTMVGGVAVTSHNQQSSAMAVTMNSPTVAAGEYPGTQLSCPGGWNCTDVGAVSPGGGQSSSGGQLTVLGGGPDIWNTADAFHYVWQDLATSGTPTISAQVASLTAADPFAKAGVMVRASTDPGSAYYAIYVTPGNGIVVQERSSLGATATEPNVTPGAAPEYLRIIETSSDTFQAAESSDGTTWFNVGGAVHIAMPGPVLAGLAVTSHDLTTADPAAFNAVTVTGGVPTSTTTATAAPASALIGGHVAYSATVAPNSGGGTPTGTVTFTTGATALCSAPLAAGTASCSSTSAPLGSDSILASYGGDGTYSASSGTAVLTVGTPAPPAPPVTTGTLSAPVVGIASLPDGTGYWLTNAAGAVSAHGNAVNYGSMAGQHLNAPITHIVATPDGEGYWLVAADGGTFTFGDAGFFGSMGNRHLNAPVVDIASTADGQGYWLVASDGGIFSFGDATFHGSMGGSHLNRPVVGVAADYATGGYWLVATDGGIFSFNAPFLGSTGSLHLNQPVNGMAPTADFQSYRFVASDGGIFSFGNVPFYGSTGGQHLNAPVLGMAADPATGGYWLVASDGGVFSFNAPFYGAR